MKKFFGFLLFLTFFAALDSCKEDTEVLYQQFRQGNGTLNGKNWLLQGLVGNCTSDKNRIDVLLGTRTTDSTSLDAMHFNCIPKKIGKYKLKSLFPYTEDSKIQSTNFSSLDQGGDVVDGVFDLLEDTNPEANVVEITAISNSRQVYEGKFSVNFYKVQANPVTCKLPDTLRITNGYFKLTLRN